MSPSRRLGLGKTPSSSGEKAMSILPSPDQVQAALESGETYKAATFSVPSEGGIKAEAPPHHLADPASRPQKVHGWRPMKSSSSDLATLNLVDDSVKALRHLHSPTNFTFQVTRTQSTQISILALPKTMGMPCSSIVQKRTTHNHAATATTDTEAAPRTGALSKHQLILEFG